MSHLVLEESADALLSMWYQAHGDGLLPNAKFVDPLKLRRWIGDISIVHLHEGEKRFFVSLHGSNVVRHLGPDFHQKYLEDSIHPIFHKSAFAPYDLSIKTKKPTYSIQRATLNNGLFKELGRMIMPLHTTDPETVSRFLIWVAPITASSARSTSIYRPFEDDEIGSRAEGAPEQTNELFLLTERYLFRENAA